MMKRSLLPSVRPIALRAMLFAAVAVGSNAAHAASVTFDWQQISGSQPGTGILPLTSSLLTPSDATGAAQFSLMLAQITYPGEPNNILESTWSASHTFSNGTLQAVGSSTPTSHGDIVTATMGTLSATGQWVLPSTRVPMPASIWTLLGGVAFLLGITRARWVKAG
jgi:hypothetical protein